MHIELYQSPFPEHFFSDFRALTASIFGDHADEAWLNSLQWRLENMPKTTVFFAIDNNKLVGYQVGYATASNRYYNWLNGVIPEYRRQGIGIHLMQDQYQWLQESSFKTLEAHVEQHNAPMIKLSLNCDFRVSGFFEKDGAPYLILNKPIVPT